MVFERFGILTCAAVLALSLPAQAREDGTQQETSLGDIVAGELVNALAGSPRPGDIAAKRDQAALESLYQERNNAPVWFENGMLSERARQAAAFLRKADDYGLDPLQYPTPADDAGRVIPLSAAELAAADLQLSRAVLAYARHAQGGRLNAARLSKFATPTQQLPDPIDVLQSLTQTADIAAALAGYNPPHEQFEALRQTYLQLRAKVANDSGVVIERGRLLRPGMRDARVNAIRRRLKLDTAADADADLYDGDVVDAVKAFQTENGLKPDGVIGPATLAIMNTTDRDKIVRILANMERWRWMPRDLGARFVWVDIPGYMVRVRDRDTEIYSGRIVVGTAQNQTPIFSDEFEYIEVNPFWNVPRSIAANEIIPEVVADPDYLRRANLEIVNGDDNVRAVRLDPWSIDWYQIDPNNPPFRFRQPPGRNNALGSIKFMFPNKHAVYLHDTPARSLFERAKRAYSHGCVRLHEPMEFARALLSMEPKITLEQVERERASRKNKAINLTSRIPVHLTYFTTRIGADGELELLEDVYGYDRRIASALDL